MRVVVYTAIIGGYDTLNEPLVKPDGVDFVCFTDREMESETWEIRKVTPLYEDSTRTARKYKVLPHRWFPEYDYSIWIDGNKIIEGNILDYISQLGKGNLSLFDHTKCFDKRNCVYQEAAAIFRLGQEPGKTYKDNPLTIKSQMERYLSEGYPQNNGLAFTCVVVRKHNDVDTVNLMEHWWTEIKYGSKRDQLSFDYVAWKNNYSFNYLYGDGRNDGIITHTNHTKKK
jgi:hypothetical protein